MLFWITTVLLAPLALGLDNDIFHKCNDEAFCATFRNQTLDENTQFVANVANASVVLNTVNIPLTNGEGEELTLELSILFESKMRIKVLEKVQRRFIIRYGIILSKIDYLPTINISGDTVTITAARAPDEKIVVKQGPPFTVECYHQDQLEIVFNGDRLVMKNTEVIEEQAFSFTVEFEGAQRLYGLAHHAFQLALKETADGSSEPFRLKNLDNSGYDADSPMALYGSIPVIYGHSANFTSGVFLHNAAQMFVDISYTGDRPSAYFMVECGHFDLILFLGPKPPDVVRQYSSMMGVTRMPQLWVFGYHQNRYTYFTQNEVKDVVAKMDEADFPLDVIFLDYGYTNQYRYFEWNPENFTDPLELQQNVSATGRRLITVSNTHVPVDLDYSVYVSGKELDFYIKKPDGSDYKDLTNAGESVWIDFLNLDVHVWYAYLFLYNNFPGTTETLAAICHGANEPSFLNDTTERTFPPETLHYDQIQNREVHNLYSLMHVRATDAGLSIRDLYKKRVFILSRAHFAGSHRYAGVWTGDNSADWPYLRNSISECLTYNLMGTVQCGANVGGFYGEPSDELLQRWYQVGIWIPYFRAHSSAESPREPYLFSEEVQAVIRLAIKTRYKHISYWYRLMFDHTQSGDPLIRPLFYSYPEYLEYDDHFLIGEDILSRPVLEPDVTQVQVSFPGDGIWYRVDDDSWTVYEGGLALDLNVNITTSPYFYRGGSIIPRMDIERPSTTQMMTDPFQLYVTLDTEDNAEGSLYFDDYTSLQYRTQISYFYFKLTYDSGTNGVWFQQISGRPDGFSPRIQRIVVHRQGTNKETITATYTTTKDGTPLEEVDIVKEHQLLRGEGNFVIYL